jgi:hypothetical protein
MCFTVMAHVVRALQEGWTNPGRQVGLAAFHGFALYVCGPPTITQNFDVALRFF